MIFHLLSDGNRSVIVPETDVKEFLRDGFTPRAARPVFAEDWLRAKELFGFELSALQREMLKGTRERAIAARNYNYSEVN